MNVGDRIYVNGRAGYVRQADGNPVLVHMDGAPHPSWCDVSLIGTSVPDEATPPPPVVAESLQPGDIRSLALEAFGYASDSDVPAQDRLFVNDLERALVTFVDAHRERPPEAGGTPVGVAAKIHAAAEAKRAREAYESLQHPPATEGGDPDK